MPNPMIPDIEGVGRGTQWVVQTGSIPDKTDRADYPTL
jgi:hypothetical protein